MGIGLAGAGRIGAFHAAALKGLDCVEQVLAADADRARTQAVAKELGCEAAADVVAPFLAGLDGVAICAHTSSHAELIGRAQDGRPTTFCQKPLASDLASTPHSAVISGSLGWFPAILATAKDPAPPHVSYIPTSGGFFLDCSIRDFDAMRFVTARELVSGLAVGRNRSAAFFAQSDDIDAAAAAAAMDDARIVLAFGSRDHARGYDVRREALGSKDSVCVGTDDRLPLHSVEKRVDFPSAMPYTDSMEPFYPGYVDELGTSLNLSLAGSRGPTRPAKPLRRSGLPRRVISRDTRGVRCGCRRRAVFTAMPTEHEVKERTGEQQTPKNEVSAANRVAAELVYGGAS